MSKTNQLNRENSINGSATGGQIKLRNSSNKCQKNEKTLMAEKKIQINNLIIPFCVLLKLFKNYHEKFCNKICIYVYIYVTLKLQLWCKMIRTI